jgi:dynein heavy chain
MIAVPFGSSQDFKWLSLVRFYWEDEHLFARFLKSKLHYGYEFQGAAEPMIITPPTERVMHAVCQAMNARWATNLWG